MYYKATQAAAAEGDKDAERIAVDLGEYYKKKASEPEEPAEAPVSPETPVTAG